jgi:two-component sensor histidine kinase
MSAGLMQRRFAATDGAPADARRWGVELLQLEGDAAIDLAILVSELVTNSLLHAGLSTDQDIVVRAGWTGSDTVHVEVCDEGGRFDKPSASAGRTGGGRGLQIVAALCADWGVHHDGVTLLWFDYCVTR